MELQMQFQSCKQCGMEKALDQFRAYYGGRKGHYKICKTCEKINSRKKYLVAKKVRSEADEQELQDIYALYDKQRSLGLAPPKDKGKRSNIVLKEELERYEALVPAVVEEDTFVPTPDNPVPPDILVWLNTPICDLTEIPDYYYDIHDELVNKYNPVTHLDPDTLKAVRKQTYKEELSKILMMFDSYNDSYDWDTDE